jgi:hypothetical protein
MFNLIPDPSQTNERPVTGGRRIILAVIIAMLLVVATTLK